MYQLPAIDPMTGTPPNTVKRISDTTWIPFDPDNRDYQEYLKWVAEGNTPLPAEE